MFELITQQDPDPRVVVYQVNYGDRPTDENVRASVQPNYFNIVSREEAITDLRQTQLVIEWYAKCELFRVAPDGLEHLTIGELLKLIQGLLFKIRPVSRFTTL